MFPSQTRCAYVVHTSLKYSEDSKSGLVNDIQNGSQKKMNDFTVVLMKTNNTLLNNPPQLKVEQNITCKYVKHLTQLKNSQKDTQGKTTWLQRTINVFFWFARTKQKVQAYYNSPDANKTRFCP